MIECFKLFSDEELKKFLSYCEHNQWSDALELLRRYEDKHRLYIPDHYQVLEDIMKYNHIYLMKAYKEAYRRFVL